jgi:hypothetical protein
MDNPAHISAIDWRSQLVAQNPQKAFGRKHTMSVVVTRTQIADTVRAAVEQALSAMGHTFNSDQVWDRANFVWGEPVLAGFLNQVWLICRINYPALPQYLAIKPTIVNNLLSKDMLSSLFFILIQLTNKLEASTSYSVRT